MTTTAAKCSSLGIKIPVFDIGYSNSLLKFNPCKTFKLGNGAGVISLRVSNIHSHIFLHDRPGKTRVSGAGRNHQLSYNDDSESHMESNPAREFIWAIRTLILFLVEQPGQLRYIEWPSFQRTLKTATLTLVLVALLIVALASVDSALSYLLALFLRRKA